jgi:8-oxo-dGTP pyrophosphatase MutT (NUDIX family)
MTQIRAVLTAAGEPKPSSPSGGLIARYPVLLADRPAGTVSVEHTDDEAASAVYEDTVSVDDRSLADLLARATSRLAVDTNGDDPVDEPELIAAGGGKRSAGIVLVDDRGWVTIREPRGHFGGYEYSYPKGRIDSGETPRQTARRELIEETGLTGRIIGTIGDFKGDVGITRFYVGVRTGGQEATSAETSAVLTVSPLSALEMLNRQRDKDVLVGLVELAAATVDWRWTISRTPVSCRLDGGRILCEPVVDSGPG